MSDQGARERGERVRRQVLGDAHVDRATEATTEFTADFQDLITRYAWGEIWTRPGLDHRTRRLLVIATTVALNREEELKLHLRAARDAGIPAADIKEVLLQCAVYCGVPAANSAFRVAAEIYA